MVDLAPTVAELLELPAAPSWVGRSLVGSSPTTRALTFDCADPEVASAVVVDGDWKLALPADPARLTSDELRSAYDLASDPGELRDQRAGEAERLAEILEARRQELVEALTPRGATDEATLDEEMARRMGALGYFELDED